MRFDTRTKGYVSILAKNWKRKAEQHEETTHCRLTGGHVG